MKAGAISNYAQLLMRMMGRSKEAHKVSAALLEEAFNICPQQENVLANLGQVYADSQRHEEVALENHINYYVPCRSVTVLCPHYSKFPQKEFVIPNFTKRICAKSNNELLLRE